MVQGGDGEEGGLTREPWNVAAPPAPQDVGPYNDLALLDDDFGTATANTDPMTRSAATRADGVNTSEGDDALPLF